MMIVRGVNVFPTQIVELILRTGVLSPHFQCVLGRAGRLDTLSVRVERRPDVPLSTAESAAATLEEQVKNTIGVTVSVEVLEPESVERSMGKMKRIVVAAEPEPAPAPPRHASGGADERPAR
jgi:phenylacetate-CoA ligase